MSIGDGVVGFLVILVIVALGELLCAQYPPASATVVIKDRNGDCAEVIYDPVTMTRSYIYILKAKPLGAQ